MKKLLMAILTLAAIAVFSFGAAACGGGTNGDSSVTTLEDAKTAYEEALNAKNYKIKITGTTKGMEGGKEISYTSKGEINYDFENKLFSNCMKYEGEGIEELGMDSDELQLYVEAVGDKLYNYAYGFEDPMLGGIKWFAQESDYTESDFLRCVAYYSGTTEGSLPESLDEFTFDESNNTFVSEREDVNMDVKITVSFRKGSLYRVFVEMSDGEGDSAISGEMECIFSFGNASVSIPQEAREALKEPEPLF